MTQRFSLWSIFLAITFLLTLTATLYFGWQLLGYTAPSPPAGLLAADKGYGVTVDLTLYDDGLLTDSLELLRENGLTWLRQPILWAEIEPAPGQFNWQPLDRIFAAIAQSDNETQQQNDEVAPKTPQDFKLIAVLHTTPTWARPANTSLTTPPTEVSDFGRFARAFAERYGQQVDGQQVDYYQIWHEPNLSANWGHAYVDPAVYTDLLREATFNIQAVDPEAVILNAALAPTLEGGPLNLNELTYLEQLYQAKANRWFDIVAGQPYGFDSKPSDPAQTNLLNFSRVELLRQVMLDHDDVDTPIWATAFGWNALPSDWSGQPSPWKSDNPQVQAQRTAAAIERARRDWPWLGPMLAIRWDATDLAVDDPARGFALVETPQVLETTQKAAINDDIAMPGHYPANHPSGHYSPGWRFSRTTADIPRHEPRTLTIPFNGTRLDLTINRGFYRGYLWVTIDEQPANALPHDGQGRSYVILYDPLRESDSVTLAQNLAPGPHKAVIEAEGGWGQWAIAGWTVYNETGTRPSSTGLILAGTLAGLSGVGLIWQFFPTLVRIAKQTWRLFELFVTRYARLPERTQITITFALALGFYFVPGKAALALFPLLAFFILLRPDLGLALIAFNLSFFQVPKQLPVGTFSSVELALALTVGGFLFRALLFLSNPKLQLSTLSSQLANTQWTRYLKATDWAALALIILGLLATLTATNFGVSIREWRVLVLESVIFYFLVRLGRDYGSPEPTAAAPSSWRWAWRLIDAFVAGATLHALLALYLYFFTDQSITAEGVHRALGPVYGSPNNLSLFLDRAWPILLAIALFPARLTARTNTTTAKDIRRGLYSIGLVIVSLTLYLTFSKGAWLVGLPTCVVVMAFLHTHRKHRRYWRRAIVITVSCLAIIALTLIPLSQTERFRTTFDFNQGSTGFIRLKLWQASLTMLRDHWPLGVGLDNFLYQYRTRYILPEAWEEHDLSHPHNLILDFGTRLGIGGIVLLLWLQAAFWVNAWRLYQKTPRPLVLGLIGSMIVFLSHGLVDHSYFLVDLAFTFFLAVGVVQKLAELDSKFNSNLS
jgi:O-antigen ligase